MTLASILSKFITIVRISTVNFLIHSFFDLGFSIEPDEVLASDPATDSGILFFLLDFEVKSRLGRTAKIKKENFAFPSKIDLSVSRSFKALNLIFRNSMVSDWIQENYAKFLTHEILPAGCIPAFKHF